MNIVRFNHNYVFYYKHKYFYTYFLCVLPKNQFIHPWFSFGYISYSVSNIFPAPSKICLDKLSYILLDLICIYHIIIFPCINTLLIIALLLNYFLAYLENISIELIDALYFFFLKKSWKFLRVKSFFLFLFDIIHIK